MRDASAAQPGQQRRGRVLPEMALGMPPTRGTAVMLDVLCHQSELTEYGQVVVVGDSIQRMAVRRSEAWFGTGLDEVEYQPDGYAGVAGDLPPSAIAGEVHAIAVIFIRVSGAAGGWRPVLTDADVRPW